MLVHADYSRGTLIIGPATRHPTAALGCPATQRGQENANGNTGYHTTAIATKMGIHHHCFACTANHAVISARIATMNRTAVDQPTSMSTGARKSTAAARMLGARALR